ncbi:MAG: winged helix DNA-binding domain-containing protein [Gemmatimonadaceae bacterium]|nr:winged helix DNA-binding domain-containing protein [Gemmatimonadaceae bacterium]
MAHTFAQHLRAWWAHRQGLDGSLAGATPEAVLDRSGWARSVAGAGPYLTLFARAGTSRSEADAAVAARSIHELPAARGCTYVLPAHDFALGLALGDAFGNGDMAQARKLGVTDKEIDRLCTAVLEALATGALAPEALREATGGASRSLGEDGKKKGLTTTLPLALGRLQASGDIRRVPVNGRLDQQRYAYTRWTPNPRSGTTLSETDAHIALAQRFFRWIGPASLKEFQWFSGASGRLAKEAVAGLQLQPAAPDGAVMLPAADLDAFRAFRIPKEPRYALVSGLDAITAARRNVTDLLDEKDLEREVVSDASLKAIGRLSDLPSHAILDRGRLIGLWEFDPEASELVYALFTGKPDAALRAAITRTETFVRDDLGDARSFSLDSPRSRAPRIAALRKAGKR